MSRMATLHPGLQARILFLSIEAGAVLVDAREVAVAEDAGIGMGFLQATEQAQHGAFLAARDGARRDAGGGGQAGAVGGLRGAGLLQVHGE